MTQTSNEVKFKYYTSASARSNDNAATVNDIAFVKTGTNTGEIYAKGYKFGMGAVSGDITVEDILADDTQVKSLKVTGASSSTNGNQVLSTVVDITRQDVKISNTVTDEYIKFTTGGLEYGAEVSQSLGESTPTQSVSTLSWAALINNISNAGGSQAPQVTNVGWSDFSAALQSHLLYVETDDYPNNTDARTSISGVGGVTNLGNGTVTLMSTPGTGATVGYPNVILSNNAVTYTNSSTSSPVTKYWSDIVAANQTSAIYWYEESAS